jgi:hypothetical protein
MHSVFIITEMNLILTTRALLLTEIMTLPDLGFCVTLRTGRRSVSNPLKPEEDPWKYEALKNTQS